MAERRNYQITVKSQNRLDGFPLEFLREVGMAGDAQYMAEGVVVVVVVEAVVVGDLTEDTNGKMKIMTMKLVTVKVAKEEMAETDAGDIMVVDAARHTMMMTRRIIEEILQEAATELQQNRPKSPGDLIENQANNIRTTEASQDTIIFCNVLDQAYLGHGIRRKLQSDGSDRVLYQQMTRTMTTEREARLADVSRIMTSPNSGICSEKIRTTTCIMT